MTAYTAIVFAIGVLVGIAVGLAGGLVLDTIAKRDMRGWRP